jgi:uncharacterized membrane protein
MYDLQDRQRCTGIYEMKEFGIGLIRVLFLVAGMGLGHLVVVLLAPLGPIGYTILALILIGCIYLLGKMVL